MALEKGEAWLTSVVEDNTVPHALVLAESLRRTKSTRKIGVIFCTKVSKENRGLLRDVFDVVVLMDEELLPSGHLTDDAHAKLHAFSLRMFEKCIYLSPYTLVLENADKLFEEDNEGQLSFMCLANGRDNVQDKSVIDLPMFLFKPCMKLYKYLATKASTNGRTLSGKYLQAWFDNQHGTKGAVNKMGFIPKKYVTTFSVENGYLQNADCVHTPVIQFHGRDITAEKMKYLQKMDNVGLVEKLIIEKWLELYNGMAVPILRNPTAQGVIHDSSEGMYRTEPIAIIGMSCRYPGANSLQEFWNLLYQGNEGICEPPAFRWIKEHTLRLSHESKNTNAGFLACPVDEFDARFFGISPKDASFMDPQTRLLHEVLWEALEDSGIDPLSLYGSRTGIFTGSWLCDYKDIIQMSPEYEFFRCYMGNGFGAAAARLSFLLGVVGPSISTESACSSSVVALDSAIKSLRYGETNLAIAGGVNLLLHPFGRDVMKFVVSPNGRCKTFDSKADGYGRAEGCGVLVLKRLSDALRDKDNIWAMVRGSGLVQEGVSKSLGTPTVHCESLAMHLALKDAGVLPEQVTYVETHGTGTPVGDPMEVAAVAKTYHTPNRKVPMYIGSVKTNVGHAESCSGITGIMKIVLALQHELIPKHRNLDELNPDINLDAIPAIITTEAVPWPKVPGTPRIAGVSSFGITGTDGHMILQEAPDFELPEFNLGMERPMHIMTVSGKSEEAITDLLKAYHSIFEDRANHEAGDNKIKFSDMAYSANTGRATFPHRVVILADGYDGAMKAIQDKTLLRGEVMTGGGKLCFLFTGQGSQYPGMAKLLYKTSPVFRVNFDKCDRILKETYNLSIGNVLWAAKEDVASKSLNRTIYSQTSIFCVEYCLLKLWQSWGVNPDFVLGHSLGEFCAAVAAGILTLEDALKLVAERSRLIDSLPRGSMLVIKASLSDVENWMKVAQIELDIAAVNSSDQTVVAGDTEQIESFRVYLKEKGFKCVLLEATHAFHSRHMDPMLEKYRNVAQTLKLKKKGNENVQYISGLAGRIITDFKEVNADYWVRHTRERVNFVEACKSATQMKCQNYMEIGANPVLSTFVLMNNEDSQVSLYPSLRRGTNDWETILTTLGKLHLSGYSIDWRGFDGLYTRKKVSLPLHPFHRKSFWIESQGAGLLPIHPLIGKQVSNASRVKIFQNDLSIKIVTYLRDHCIGNRIVLPGAALAEMLITAGYCVANGLDETLEVPKRPVRIENCRIESPLELYKDRSSRIQCTVDLLQAQETSPEMAAGDAEGFQVKVFREATGENSHGKWAQHASCKFLVSFPRKGTLENWRPERIKEIMGHCEANTPEALYKKGDKIGLTFGETFKMIKKYWCMNVGEECDESVAVLDIPDDAHKYLVHPIILDAMFQTGILTKYRYDQSNRLTIPIGFAALTIFLGGSDLGKGSLYIHGWFQEDKLNIFVGQLDEESGIHPVAFIQGAEMIETNVRTIESVLEQQTRSVPDAWEEVWKVIPGSCFGSRVELMGNVCMVNTKDQVNQDHCDLDKNTDRFIYLSILKALYQVDWKPKLNETFTATEFCIRHGIIDKYVNMVQFYLAAIEEEHAGNVLEWNAATKMWLVRGMPPTLNEIQTELSLMRIMDEKIIGVYDNISNNLASILTGKENPMAILFPESIERKEYSLEEYNKMHSGQVSVNLTTQNAIKNIFEEIRARNQGDHHDEKSKVLKVLHLGGQTTTDASRSAMDALRNIWGSHWEYTYTETGSDFLQQAEKDLDEFKEFKLKFIKFNVKDSPLKQGIPLNYFDVVMVTSDQYLHGQKNLEESLLHLRQIMREGGILCFAEALGPQRDLTFVRGLLDTFWNWEDTKWRQSLPFVKESDWEKLLAQCGFNFIQVAKSNGGRFGCITTAAAASQKVQKCVCKQSGKGNFWVVFATEKSPATLKISATLENCGYNVVTVYKSCEAIKHPGVSIKEDNEDPSEIESILSTSHNSEKRIEGVVYGWGLDLEEIDQAKIALPFMHIVKTVLTLSVPPKLYIVTQGVHDVTDDVVENPAAATLYGMAKSLKNEYFELFIKCVDLEGREEKECLDYDLMADQLLFEIAMGMRGTEDNNQVAYRENVRYEPKLAKCILPHPSEELQLPPGTDRYRMAHPKSRLINDISFESLDQEELREEMIEVKVKSYALNLKDIFTIVKPIPEFEQLHAVGLDFAGVVSRVGPGVSPQDFKVGDRVLGSNRDQQMPSHMVAHTSQVAHIPDHVSCWEASTIPLVFVTACYGIIQVAKLQPGETVLIHTGAGGVGMSAIQIAMKLGAKIITTAGNPRKRAYLKGMGIKHVFHSRNTSYEKEIMKVTNGKGVDVVLNSLTGPGFKEATLAACGRNARFLEISKITIWTAEEVHAIRPDVKYTVFDVLDLAQQSWTGLLTMSQNSMRACSNMTRFPFMKFDALNFRQALQYFQKAKHICKLICVMPDVTVKNGQYHVNVPLFNDESSYLITGGLGGIGFEVCKWMMEKGATDVVLTGRSPPKPEIANKINELNAQGYNVVVMLGDVGDYERCKEIIGKIDKAMKPLRGIMHSAGVLRDNLYGNQNWESFSATFRSKVSGTWNLHKLTKGLPLEHFVMYSSLTALIGTPAQPNHSAANCFEDQFAKYRWSMGLPAVTVNWGQWAQVGCAKELTLTGVLPVSVKRMLSGLEVLLRTPQKIQACFSEFESFSNLSLICPQLKSYLDPRLWKQVGKEGREGGVQGVNAEQFWTEMNSCVDKKHKVGVIAEYLKKILRSALRLDPSEPINDDQNIRDLGADSLMLMELKNSIQSLMGGKLTISASMLQDCNTVRELATAIVNKMGEDDHGDDGEMMEPMMKEELLQLLENDCSFDEDIKINGDRPKKMSEIASVLVTGVTGHLAPYILAQLSNRDTYPGIEQIVCLIRGREDGLEEKFKAVIENVKLIEEIDLNKIKLLRGDVTQKLLGLEENVYEELCQNVDAVIHCAAKNNHVEHYRLVENGKDVRSVNVLGTKNIIRFAADGKTKHVYHASIFSSMLGGEGDESTMSDQWPAKTDLSLLVEADAPGYPISKVVCELLMQQANEKGIPCKVFRFPWIAGNSLDGRMSVVNGHYILKFLSYLKLKAIPDVMVPANVLPADLCAKLSVRIFMMEDAPCEIFNVCHPRPELEQDFVRVAKENFDMELQIVDYKQFSAMLQKVETPLGSLKELYKSLEKTVDIYNSDKLNGPQAYFNEPEVFFTNNKVQKLLPNFEKGIESSMEFIKRDLLFVKSQGAFEKFGI